MVTPGHLNGMNEWMVGSFSCKKKKIWSKNRHECRFLLFETASAYRVYLLLDLLDLEPSLVSHYFIPPECIVLYCTVLRMENWRLWDKAEPDSYSPRPFFRKKFCVLITDWRCMCVCVISALIFWEVWTLSCLRFWVYITSSLSPLEIQSTVPFCLSRQARAHIIPCQCPPPNHLKSSAGLVTTQFGKEITWMPGIHCRPSPSPSPSPSTHSTYLTLSP